MKVIKVKKDEIQLLRGLNNTVLSDYLDKAHFDSKSSSLVLTLETRDLDEITDELAAILTNKGITNNEINNFGKEIDDLISKFSPYE
jgi:hypothetical protein